MLSVAGGAPGEGRLLGRLHTVLSPKDDAIAGVRSLQAAPTRRGMGYRLNLWILGNSEM
jgi:hypothetical protein